MSKRVIVICTLVRSHEGGVPLGTAEWPCTRCGRMVYVTPESQENVEEEGAEIMCPLCAVRNGAGIVSPEMLKLPPEDLLEVEGYLRRN